MKSFTWIFLACIGLYISQTNQVSAQQPGKADLVVTITGIDSAGGTIKIGLFNREAGFLDVSQVMRGVNQPAQQGQMSVVFEDLPAGQYAVSIIHDENQNGFLDKNILGIPKEGYGFSRNVRPFLSPPSFSATSVTLSGINMQIQIGMRY